MKNTVTTFDISAMGWLERQNLAELLIAFNSECNKGGIDTEGLKIGFDSSDTQPYLINDNCDVWKIDSGELVKS